MGVPVDRLELGWRLGACLDVRFRVAGFWSEPVARKEEHALSRLEMQTCTRKYPKELPIVFGGDKGKIVAWGSAEETPGD